MTTPASVSDRSSHCLASARPATILLDLENQPMRLEECQGLHRRLESMGCRIAKGSAAAQVSWNWACAKTCGLATYLNKKGYQLLTSPRSKNAADRCLAVAIGLLERADPGVLVIASADRYFAYHAGRLRSRGWSVYVAARSEAEVAGCLLTATNGYIPLRRREWGTIAR